DQASSSDDLLHRADVCAYRAKAQGRNRVVAASSLTVLDEVGWERAAPASAPVAPEPGPAVPVPEEPALSHRPPAPNHLSLRRSLRVVIAAVASAGFTLGVCAMVAGSSRSELVGCVVLVGLVAIGQAVAVEALDQSTISLSAVGSLAGAALFGPEVA